jgi:ATP-binding cassette subfamily F protein 3
MRQALTMALQNFDGAIVVVSHDRHLLRNTVDEFWLVSDGTVQEYDGDLEDYERWLADRRKDEDEPPKRQVAEDSDAEKKAGSAQALTADERKARKRQEAELRQKLSPWRKKQVSLEARMDQLQQQLAGVEASLGDPAVYEDSGKVRLKTLLAEQTELKRALEETEAEWLEVSETVENLEAELAG